MTWILDATEFYRQHANCGTPIQHTATGTAITYRCTACGVAIITTVSADELIDGLEKLGDMLRQQHNWTQGEADALLMPFTAALESGDHSPQAESAAKCVKAIIDARE